MGKCRVARGNKIKGTKFFNKLQETLAAFFMPFSPSIAPFYFD